MKLLLLLASLAAAEFLPAALLYQPLTDADAADPLVVQTEYGPIKGYYQHTVARGSSHDWFKANTPRAFAAVPFADPPTGKNRFRDPQPLSTPWANGGKKRLALVNSPACPQTRKTIQREDCLYLDIYTPPIERIKKAGGKLPVLFWLYGGAFVMGSNRQYLMYNGRSIAKAHDVIVVVPNYRLGVLGYMVAPTSPTDALTGNYGIKDQIAALRFVTRNIRHFGGDPRKVTVIGESAGATSALIHLVSPATKGMVHAVGVMSAPMISRHRTVGEASKFGLEYARNVSCVTTTGNKEYANVECLRSLSTKQLMTAQVEPGIRSDLPTRDMGFWWPHVDKTVLPDDVFTLLEQGKAKRVPILMGWMRDEGGMDTFDAHTPIIRLFKDGHRAFQYDAIVARGKNAFGSKAPLVLAKFPLSKTDVEHNENQMVRIGTEYMFKCSSYYIAQKLASHGFQVHLYEVRKIQRFVPWGRCNKDLACHAFELGFLWQPVWFHMDAEEKRFATKFVNYFAGFVRGNINAKAAVQWPAFKRGGRIMVLNSDLSLAPASHYDQMCSFWEKTVGYRSAL